MYLVTNQSGVVMKKYSSIEDARAHVANAFKAWKEHYRIYVIEGQFHCSLVA